MASAGKTLQFTKGSKKTGNRGNIKKMTLTAMLAAIAVILMYMEIPVPFMPGFIKLDISDLPALFGSFIYGPLCGVFICLVKNVLHSFATNTMFVGEISNFILGCAFVVPAGLIYRLRHTKSRKHAVLGMAAGTLLTTAAACLMNAFVLLPAYGKAFGMPIEAFIEMGAAVNSSVHSLLGFVVLIIVPFNLFKYTLTSVIVFFIYKRIRVILKGD